MADYYLCSGKLIKPDRDGPPTNLKIGDIQYWNGREPDSPAVYVVEQVWSAIRNTRHEYRPANHEEICLIKTHILINS